MKYYLDLEGLSDSFNEAHGLIEIGKDTAESMVQNDGRLELAVYEHAAPAYTSVRFKKLSEYNEGKNAVDTLYESMRQFTLHLIDWDGEDMQNSVIADMVPHLTPEARSQLIFLLLTVGHSDNDCELDTAGKQFAVVLAETMGPDWAQWLYNFAKVVTKLA